MHVTQSLLSKKADSFGALYKAELTSRVEHFNTGILSYETKMT